MPLPFRAAAPPRTRKRLSFLTRDEIVAAAAALLERDGYDALNMRAVAAELGVQAAALYRHVESRWELDDLLFDHLMADCRPHVPSDDWREDLLQLADAWRRCLVSKRDATRIAFAQVSIGPHIAPLLEAALNALQRSGLGDGDLMEVYNAFLVIVHGLASAEASDREQVARPADGSRAVPIRPEWAQTYPTLSRLAQALSVPPDFDAQFAFALKALIAGIEQRRAAS
jgi:TetR/AcrR family tetracycline transcriptional repressor